MPSLFDPIPRGVAMALGSVALVTVGGAFFASAIPAASPELLRSLATIGAILVPAYVVEAVWLVPRVDLSEDYEEWLGFVVGAGIAGLLAIAIALLAAEHRVAGHSNALSDVSLAWVVASEAILAGVLVLQPLLAHRLRDDDELPQ